MFIEKNYNVKSLAETLDGALSVALDDGKIAVEIGLLEANEIKEILEMMAVGDKVVRVKQNGDSKEKCEKRKERNETMCDDCLMSGCCTVDCTNEHITEQMLGGLKKCFGKYYGKRPIIVCGTCKYKYQCEVLTKHE